MDNISIFDNLYQGFWETPHQDSPFLALCRVAKEREKDKGKVKVKDRKIPFKSVIAPLLRLYKRGGGTPWYTRLFTIINVQLEWELPRDLSRK